jgi:hypothetical protein
MQGELRMKRLTILALAALLPCVANAQIVDDPLHGEICTSSTGGCSNAAAGNSNTPIMQGTTPIQNFGFASAPSLTGTVTLDILVPFTGSFGGAPQVNLTNGSPITSLLFTNGFGVGIGVWAPNEDGITNPTLAAFLQNNASPDMNVMTYLTATNALEASLGQTLATGFVVFQVSGLGPWTLPTPSSTGQVLPDIFSMDSLLPAGAFLVASIQEANGTVIDTANSGALFVTPAAAVPEPSTWAMMLLGFCGLGFAFRQSRRKVSFA